MVFRPIGAAEKGYTHTVLGIIGRGSYKPSAFALSTGEVTASHLQHSARSLICLTSQGALAASIANKHAIDKSASAAHFVEILKAFDLMPLYLANKMSSADKSADPKEFSQLTSHSCKR